MRAHAELVGGGVFGADVPDEHGQREAMRMDRVRSMS